jgi:acetyl-CoA synthetase (ADP-forming)
MAASSAKRIVEDARKRGQKTLSEYDSKRVLKAYGIPVTRETLVSTPSAAKDAARKLGYPVVLKACSADATHKTEKGLVAVGLGSDRALSEAFRTLKTRAGKSYDGDYLVQEMVRGDREIMIGMIRDDQFGPSVMFGLGGIFTEVLEDVVFRVAPLTKADAGEMMRGIRGHKILDAIRGMKAVDREVLAKCLIGIGKLGIDFPEIREIDINPLIIKGARPVAVDGLIVLDV